MNKSILWVIGPFLLLFSACGERSPSSHPPSAHYDCARKIIPDGECFYPLLPRRNGQTYEESFAEDLAINTRGVTVGQGKWECLNNSWQPIYEPLCITCNPGVSLTECERELNRRLNSRVRSF